MFDVINNLYPLIVSVQMETGSVLDRSNNISVSIGLQNVMDRYGADQKAIRYNGNIVLECSSPLTSIFIIPTGIVFNRSNGLMIKCLIA